MSCIICLLLATVCIFIFAGIVFSAGDNLVKVILTAKIETCKEDIQQAMIERELLVEEMKRKNDMTDKKCLKKGKELTNKIAAKQKELERLQKGKLGIGDVPALAGYRLIQMLGWDATNEFIKEINQKCMQYKEKKEAINYTYYVVGNLMGYVMLGICVLFALLGCGLALNGGVTAIGFAVIMMAFCLVFGYAPYDAVNQIIKDRNEQIERQFPQVVSKLTLLTVAGLEVNQAWNLTCKSGSGTLYEEMNRVNTDFANNVAPVDAYSKFMIRCNNNYTTKLATAIMQNMSKGNSEIVALFTQINAESWLEHKHNARKMGEKISGKLTVPTMLLFAGILIMIIVPVCTGFNM